MWLAGKILLAGEYSVLTRGNHAFSFPIKNFCQISALPSTETKIVIKSKQKTFSLEINNKIHDLFEKKFLITLNFHNNKPSGVSATLAVFLAFYKNREKNLTKKELFKEATKIHEKIQGVSGSGYDIATIIFNSAVLYENNDISKIKTIPSMNNWHILMATGEKKGRTSDLIKKYFEAKLTDPQLIQSYEQNCEKLTLKLFESYISNDFTSFAKYFVLQRKNFHSLKKIFKHAVFSNRVEKALQIAEKENVLIKTAGAGGDEQMIAIGKTKDEILKAEKILRNCGFESIVYLSRV